MTETAARGARPPIPDDPRLVPLLPMVYVAWADGELSAGEIRSLADGVRGLSWLEPAQADAVAAWLDPAAPPTAQEIKRLLRRIRGVADAMPAAERTSLAQIGIAMANADADEAGVAWINPDTRRALARLEDTLGVVATDAIREMLRTGEGRAIPGEEKPPEPTVAAVDAAKLGALLDGARRPTRERVRALLQRPVFRYAHELDKTSYRQRVLEWVEIFAEEGIGKLAYPEVTGAAEDVGDFVAAFETLAFFDLSLLVKMGVQFGLFGGAIYHLGNEEQRQSLLPRVATGELLGCFAMTELGHGSNVRELRTVARWDGATREFVLQTPTLADRKEWIGNAAAHARMAAVFAQLEIDDESYGVHAFVVPIRGEDGKPAPGVSLGDCGPKLGLNGVDNGWIRFAGVRVPRAALLDRFARVDEAGGYDSSIPSATRRFFTMLSTLVGGRISIAGASVSVAKSALAIALRYGSRRRQFGRPGEIEVPVLDYATHQRRLMPLLATTYALHFAQQDLVDRWIGSSGAARDAATDGGEPDEAARQVETLAAGLKSLASWHATRTVQVCRECCGAEGYRAVNRFASLKADSDIFTTFEGDNTVLLQLVAKSLLVSFKRQFGSMRVFGMLRWIADRAGTAIKDFNPVAIRRTSSDHLRDPEFQRTIFGWREQSLTLSAAKRLKKRLDAGVDSFDAFIQCQNHLLALARASVERGILETALDAVARVDDPALRPALDRLIALYGLTQVEADLGFFLENDVVESKKARAIRREVDALCAELRPEAVALVDAFGIPESVLAAPIATRAEVEEG